MIPIRKVREQSRLHIVMFASIIVVIIFSSSLTSILPFPAANALILSESIQFTSNNNNATSTEVQETLISPQEAIMNHLEMARLALTSGNLTMAIQELISAIELQSGLSSDDEGIAQNETQSRMELQTAPFPPDA